MKIVRRDYTHDGPGSIKMTPVDSDDLWYAYNLIVPGDSVMAVTVRKVLREMASGNRDAERVKLKLEVKVEGIEYDKDGGVLRIRGKNILENEHVKIGQFHTLEIELHRPFVLRKRVWDSLALEVIKQASDPTASADVTVLLMQEGLAQIFLVGRSVTTSRSRIETSIPRKHGPAIAGYDSVRYCFCIRTRFSFFTPVSLVDGWNEIRITVITLVLFPSQALNKFFQNVLQAFLKHVDFNVVRCAVIGSPGFTKDQFHRFLLLEAERKQLRSIIENKSKIILVHTTSGYKHSLREVLDAPSVMNIIKDTKAAEEDSDRACYGPKHVEVANERLAVQTLLITDDLFRNADIPTRQKYVNLVKSVKSSGGKAHIFSTMHSSGEQLAQLTGIAAILRFPLPDLEDIEM
ncbi:Protein PELOTA 1 [Linum perenne]